MGEKKQNLSSYTKGDLPDASSMRFGIVWAEWNADITDILKQGCIDTLLDNGAKEAHIYAVSVPGSFELPYGGKLLLKKHKCDAIIALGCVIQGETNHNLYINHTVAQTLSALSVSTGVPFIFGVLTPSNYEQALDRAGGKCGNKGVEAAVTAIKMAQLKIDENGSNHKIGF